MVIDPYLNQSFISQQMRMDNFTPKLSAKLTTAGTSGSVTFSPITGTLRTTFKITNHGANGAYIGWGHGTATAVASTTTPAANCDYIAAGAIITQDFQSAAGPVDTIAAIQETGSTVLEISIGFGQ